MTRLHAPIRVLLCILSLTCVGMAHAAFTITGSTPGNVITTGSPLIFTVQGAEGNVQYSFTDYFGQTVASNTAQVANGAATITAPTLSPGFYTLTCNSGTEHATVSLGVLLDRGNAPLPRDGRVGTDAALSWLVSNENIPLIVHMIRLAGIPWVRERLAWHEIEPTAGARKWTESNQRYQTAADAYAREGVFVESMWHDAPEWSHPGLPGPTYGPDDLRIVYAFARDTAQRYAHTIQAWEVWNEPDIPSWSDLSDRFVGYVQASYLGLKAGDPTLQIFPGAMCSGYSHFGQHVYDNIGGFGDGFAWHVYDQTTDLPSWLPRNYASMFGKSTVAGKPIRLTECGIHVQVPRQGEHVLGMDAQRQQCQFIPRMAACGLAAGNEKVFYFVLPEYMEGMVQYGLLHGDLTPNPGFVALSAAANFIGVSRYLGEYREAPSVSAYAFTTSRGTVLVAWADTPTTLRIPTERRQICVANIFGAQQTITAKDGQLTMPIGPDACYLVDIGNTITKQLRTPAPGKKPGMAKTAPVVIVGHDDRTLTKDRSHDAYQLERVDTTNRLLPFHYQVDVYNFGEQATRGTVRPMLPAGWQVTPASNTVTVPAMGRVTCDFTITPSAAPQVVTQLTVRGTFGTLPVAPSASYFMLDPKLSFLRDTKRRTLPWTDARQWNANNAAIAPTTVTNADAETLQLNSKFTQQGDRWAYPTLKLTSPLGRDAYVITFDYQCSVDSPGSTLRLMCVEGNGATYMTSGGFPITSKPQHAVVYLRELSWLGLSPKDSNGHLDLNQVTAIQLGGNFVASGLDQVTVTLRHFSLYSSTEVPIVAEAEGDATTHNVAWGPGTDAGYSGGHFLNLWESGDPGPEGYWVNVPFTVPTAGRYVLYFCGNGLARLASPCSISPFTWRIDAGETHLANAPLPQETPPGIREFNEMPGRLGTVQLTAGQHTFHLSVNARRVACDTNYALWFDAIILRPTK